MELLETTGVIPISTADCIAHARRGLSLRVLIFFQGILLLSALAGMRQLMDLLLGSIIFSIVVLEWYFVLIFFRGHEVVFHVVDDFFGHFLAFFLGSMF